MRKEGAFLSFEISEADAINSKNYFCEKHKSHKLFFTRNLWNRSVQIKDGKFILGKIKTGACLKCPCLCVIISDLIRFPN